MQRQNGERKGEWARRERVLAAFPLLYLWWNRLDLPQSFWLLRRLSLSWQMAASERRTHQVVCRFHWLQISTHHTSRSHMLRLVASRKKRDKEGHGRFNLWGVGHPTAAAPADDKWPTSEILKLAISLTDTRATSALVTPQIRPVTRCQYHFNFVLEVSFIGFKQYLF